MVTWTSKTNSKQKGYSGEASQQTVHISCKTKLHFCAYNSPQLGTMLNSMSSFHNLQTYFSSTIFLTHSNLCTRFPRSLLCSGFPITTSFPMLLSLLKLISTQTILAVRQTHEQELVASHCVTDPSINEPCHNPNCIRRQRCWSQGLQTL